MSAQLLLFGLTALAGDLVGEQAAERTRLQRHLSTVEVELRARDAGHLPPSLQEQRRRNLERLHAYWTAGEFPRNDDFPGERVPYFIDDDEVPCAVGFLVIDSGFADVAQQIRDTENNARLLDMTHPALPEWIAASGLTAEECARIQPTYCNCGDEDVPVCGVDNITYSNKCVAQSCAGVEIAYEGACKGQETTTGWPLPGTGSTTDTTGGAEVTGSSSTSNASSNTDASNTSDASSSTSDASSTTGSTSATSFGGTSSGAGEASATSMGDGESSRGESSGAVDTTGESHGAGAEDEKAGCHGCRATDSTIALLGLLAAATRRRRRS